MCELDEALGPNEMASWELRDCRISKNFRHNVLAITADCRFILAYERRGSHAAIGHDINRPKYRLFHVYETRNAPCFRLHRIASSQGLNCGRKFAIYC